MCLILTIQALETTRSALEEAARLMPPAALRLHLEPISRRPWGRTTIVEGSICKEGGCACSLLADDADWAAPFWSMRPGVLEPLAQTLEAVGAAMEEEFTVAARWVGDSPPHEQVVSLAELVAVARAGQLGTRTRYRVPPELR
jgi:hypothetical protein